MSESYIHTAVAMRMMSTHSLPFDSCIAMVRPPLLRAGRVVWQPGIYWPGNVFFASLPVPLHVPYAVATDGIRPEVVGLP